MTTTKLEEMIMQELKDLKAFRETVADDKYFSKIEVDYLHFVDLFIKEYTKQQIIDKLNELYDRGIITAIRNPQGLLFEIKLKSKTS